VKFPRSKRWAVAIAALILLLFLFRPGVYRLRNRISTSIGNALGRRVAIDNVRFHVLPRPGFALEGLVIYDDPAFSAEPMIRADEVFAAIRFRSLFRGRLEIATLSATEPSVNLVRNMEGHWNLAALLERNAQIPAAPTEKPASERRLAFPYLEASNARVNFKLGQTKKSYALLNADVALWQDSENSWGARLKAEPVRTDFHLTDTGVVQINASWQRASSLRLTPMLVTVRWQRGQLGQISQLISGKDRGWRGGVNFAARLSGTPEALRIESQVTVEDFRRYDIVDTENVRLVANCAGQYKAVPGALDEVRCESPVGIGALRLHGSAIPMAQPPVYDLTLAAEKVPLASLVRLLRHAKQGMPRDLTASGVLNAEFRARKRAANSGVTNGSPMAQREKTRIVSARDGTAALWSGTGLATDVILSSNAGKDEVVLGKIPFTLIARDIVSGPARRGTPNAKKELDPTPLKDSEPTETHLRMGPATVAMRGSTPVSAGGWISASGYFFSVHGEAELKDLFRLERVFGLPVARPAAEGSARLDVGITGLWRGFAAPSTMGTAQLHNVRAEVRGLNTPIEIGSANVALTADLVSMQKISARTGTSHWTGGVTALRHCAAATATAVANPGAVPSSVPNCVLRFDLTVDQLEAAEIAEWFTRHPAKRPWYGILRPDTVSNGDDGFDQSPLLALEAHGTLHVGRFAWKKFSARQVVTGVEVDRGKFALSNLSAQMLQGTYRGNWLLDASRARSSPAAAATGNVAERRLPVRFHATGTLQDIALEQLGALMSDIWVTGAADANFDVAGEGNSFRELLAGSDGKLQLAMRNGTLPHVAIPGAPTPLPVHRFAGDLRLKKGGWELSAGKMESRDGEYRIHGTASADGLVDFVLTRGDEQSWRLTGTLAEPQVTPEIGAGTPATEPSPRK
jgi:hypothetical protein